MERRRKFNKTTKKVIGQVKEEGDKKADLFKLLKLVGDDM